VLIKLMLASICFWSALIARSQILLTKSIKEFGAHGDGRTNDHLAFEKAAKFFNQRRGQGKLFIPRGVYVVGRQDLRAGLILQHVLEFKGCQNLTIEGNGAVIKYKDSLRYGAFDPSTSKPYYSDQPVFAEYSFGASIGNFIQLTNCNNIVVKNIEVDGNQKGMILGGKFGDTGFQLGHDGVFIENSTNVLLDRLWIHHMGRDGIQIANMTVQNSATPDQKITISNCVFEYNGRQGVSWVGGSGLKVKNCKFNSTGRGRFYSAPAAGFDIEAEIGIVQNGIFDNCEFIDNIGCGMVADSGESMNMQFSNCTFWGISTWSMWTTKANYNFRNCKFYGSIVQGFDSPDDKNATKFFRCVFKDSAYRAKPAYGQYLVEINYKRRMLFDSCTFITRTKKIFWFEGNPAWRPEEKPLITESVIHIYPSRYVKPDFLAKMHGVRWDNAHYFIYMKENEYVQNYYIPGGDVTFLRNSSVKYIPSK
jgi:hypothetical protein